MDSLNLNAYTRDICMRTQKLIERNRSMSQVRENKTKKKSCERGLRCLWGKKVFNKYILYILAHNCTGKPH